MSPIVSIWVILGGIFLAAFAAGSETAVVSCSKVRLAALARGGSWRARSLENLLAKPERFFSVVLVATNVAVIFSTVAATDLSVHFFQERGAAVATAVMVPVLLIFGEVIPKSLFLYHADRVAVAVAPGLRLLEIVLWPLVAPASALVRALLGAGKMGSSKFNILSSREELIYMYSIGKRKAEMEEREHLIINRVFRFGEVKVRELLLPMDNVVHCSENESVNDVIARIEKYPYSRFPVVSSDGKKIVGVITIIDLLGLDGGEKVSSVMRKPLFALASDSAEKLLIQMKDEATHMAVVIGDRGQTLGIVTLEDILESIVGFPTVNVREIHASDFSHGGSRLRRLSPFHSEGSTCGEER